MKDVMTFNIKIEKTRRRKHIEELCQRLGLNKDMTQTISILLEVSMDDAYACGRIDKENEILASQKPI